VTTARVRKKAARRIGFNVVPPIVGGIAQFVNE
jgi:hypothetical protein